MQMHLLALGMVMTHATQDRQLRFAPASPRGPAAKMVRQPAVLAQLFDRFVKGCGGRLRSASRCREGRCREAGLAWTFPLHRTSVRYSEAVGFSRLRSTRVRLIKRPVGGDVDALPLNRTRTVPPGSAKYAVIAEADSSTGPGLDPKPEHRPDLLERRHRPSLLINRLRPQPGEPDRYGDQRITCGDKRDILPYSSAPINTCRGAGGFRGYGPFAKGQK
jgi:hypothetical protein